MEPTTPETNENNPIRRGTFLLFLLGVTLSFAGLIQQFAMACFWAATLAVVFHGFNIWILKKYPGRGNLASVITLLVVLLVVVTPIFFLTLAVVNESQYIYSAIEDGTIDPEDYLRQIENMVPYVEDLFGNFGMAVEEIDARIEDFGKKMISGLGNIAVKYTQNAINIVVQFTLMMYLLFFFLRDGDSIVAWAKAALPLGDRTEDLLFKRFASVSRATLKGTLVVAIIQGAIGGIAFAILGIPAATLWGVLMIFLSLLPVGGSMLVWGPAAALFFLNGEIGKGIILVIIGTTFIGLIDNLLRPYLVSRETQMPDYLVLLATLGGLAQFGLTGFIIGPVIAALFVTFWEITGERFGGSDL